MARYIFKGGREVIIEPEAHKLMVDLTPAELIKAALDMAEVETTRGFTWRSALLVELAYRLEGMSFPDDDPDVEQKLEFDTTIPGDSVTLPMVPETAATLIIGPGISQPAGTVELELTPETTLTDLMAALEKSVKAAKESRKRKETE